MTVPKIVYAFAFIFFTTTSFAITNGVPLKDSDESAVVFITDSNGRCTGVLISEDVVLTAEHCVSKKNPKEVSINGKSIVQKILVPAQGNSQIRLDLALLKLKKGMINADSYTI